jgi:hypothetical protein
MVPHFEFLEYDVNSKCCNHVQVQWNTLHRACRFASIFGVTRAEPFAGGTLERAGLVASLLRKTTTIECDGTTLLPPLLEPCSSQLMF